MFEDDDDDLDDSKPGYFQTDQKAMLAKIDRRRKLNANRKKREEKDPMELEFCA